MSGWLLIIFAVIIAFFGTTLIGERLSGRMARQARQKRTGITYNRPDDADGEDTPAGE